MKSTFPIFAFMILAGFAGCKKDEAPKPDSSYYGALTLTYARTFPEFSITVPLDVEIDKSGDVYISQTDQVLYNSGEDVITIDDSQIKQKETGIITITSLSGTYKEKSGTGYLSVNASTLIEGTQTTWAWDEVLGWVLVGEVPFSVEDPIESPMDFNIDDAVMELNGSQLGTTIQVPPFGSMTFTWTVGLTAGL
jgi:hypothetical protein